MSESIQPSLEIFTKALESSIWKADPVKDQPEVQVRNWTIKHTTTGDHIVGDEVGGLGRVSTVIVAHDGKIAKTRSGRIYELLGEPGYSYDGEYVWESFKRINRLVEVDPLK